MVSYKIEQISVNSQFSVYIDIDINIDINIYMCVHIYSIALSNGRAWEQCYLNAKSVSSIQVLVTFLKRFYLFIFRERGREGEEHRCVRETSIGCLPHMPQPGTGPQPRYVPRPGTEMVTFCCVGQYSTN